MTAEDKKEIIAYLSGPREYRRGVDLYTRHGLNRMLRRRFIVEDTPSTRAFLMEELRKMAGLTEAQYKNLPRLAAGNNTIAPAAAAAVDATQAARIELDAAPESVQRVIKFREKYSFLAEPDCPDELKVCVADMFTARDKYRAAHRRLMELPADAITAGLIEAATVVENYLAYQELHRELDHYNEHREVLGEAARIKAYREEHAIAEYTDIQLAAKLNSARANVSKRRKAYEALKVKGLPTSDAENALNRWTDMREALEREVARRKKK